MENTDASIVNMQNIKEKKKKRRSEIFFILVMLSLPIASFLVFWLYVNFSSILMAFQVQEQQGANLVMKWSGYNFVRFFNDISSSDSVLLPALKNTILFFVSNVFLVLPVAVFMCYFIYKKIFMYRFFRFVFFLPSIVMATVLVVLFKDIIGDGGPIARLFIMAGKEPIHFLADSNYAINTILFYTIFTTFGGNLVLLGGAVKAIDESIIEAGQLDGVGMFREIFQIIIPIIWPTLSTMIVLASVGIFTASGPILLFSKEAEFGTNTIAYWIFQQVNGFPKQNEYASAVGLIFTAIGLPIVLIIKKLLNAAIAEIEY